MRVGTRQLSHHSPSALDPLCPSSSVSLFSSDDPAPASEHLPLHQARQHSRAAHRPPSGLTRDREVAEMLRCFPERSDCTQSDVLRCAPSCEPSHQRLTACATHSGIPAFRSASAVNARASAVACGKKELDMRRCGLIFIRRLMASRARSRCPALTLAIASAARASP
jgi:hypothetical protein